MHKPFRSEEAAGQCISMPKEHQAERLHLTDVGFQGDSTQETVDAQRIGSQRRREVAQHDPHCDRNPGCVRVQFVVLHFGQNINVLVP